MVDDLLPMGGLLLRLCQLLQLKVEVLDLAGQFLATYLEFTESDSFRLIRIEQSVALAFDALPPLEQLRLLGSERSQVMLLGPRPTLMQGGDHTRRPQELTQRLPDDGIQTVRPHEARGTFRQSPAGQGLPPGALIVE